MGDFVTSMRKHRDDSHRVRIFSEFAGVDIRRPQKALSLHIMVVHQVRKHELAQHVQRQIADMVCLSMSAVRPLPSNTWRSKGPTRYHSPPKGTLDPKGSSRHLEALRHWTLIVHSYSVYCHKPRWRDYHKMCWRSLLQIAAGYLSLSGV